MRSVEVVLVLLLFLQGVRGPTLTLLLLLLEGQEEEEVQDSGCRMCQRWVGPRAAAAASSRVAYITPVTRPDKRVLEEVAVGGNTCNLRKHRTREYMWWPCGRRLLRPYYTSCLSITG